MGDSSAPGHFYDVLQVSPTAAASVIEAAYRALRGQINPDSLCMADIEAAQRLGEAYRTLIDPAARQDYDASLKMPDPLVVGSFKIVERLAESGNCYIYRGEHRLNGIRVCVKHCFLLDPSPRSS
jgi:curved DNA-binding protein CbpA